MNITLEKRQKFDFSFYVCTISYSLERCAFYSAKWLIAAMLVANIGSGGLGLEKGEAAIITSYLVASTYFAPIIGAYISDMWIGARYLIPLGTLLIGCGYFVGWQADSVNMVYIMILLIAVGTALFKSQTNALTGRLLRIEELNRAFSVRYSLANIGSFSGTLLIGIIAASFGFSRCFLICGIIMLISTIWFLYGWKYLGDAGKKPFMVDERYGKCEEEKERKQPLTRNEKKRVLAIFMISGLAVIFWLFWYMSYMFVYYHWNGEQAAANWMIGNFTIPSSWFDSLNSLCCITMGPGVGVLWSRLSKRPQGDLNMFKKIGLGLFCIGVAYLVLGITEVMRGESPANLIWIILFGVLMSLGEMVFSPLGNAFVSQFAPGRLLSNMMSVWALAMFVAASLYGYLYEYVLRFEYATIYFVISFAVICSSVILWLTQEKLNKILE